MSRYPETQVPWSNIPLSQSRQEFWTWMPKCQNARHWQSPASCLEARMHPPGPQTLLSLQLRPEGLLVTGLDLTALCQALRCHPSGKVSTHREWVQCSLKFLCLEEVLGHGFLRCWKKQAFSHAFCPLRALACQDFSWARICQMSLLWIGITLAFHQFLYNTVFYLFFIYGPFGVLKKKRKKCPRIAY